MPLHAKVIREEITIDSDGSSSELSMSSSGTADRYAEEDDEQGLPVVASSRHSKDNDCNKLIDHTAVSSDSMNKEISSGVSGAAIHAVGTGSFLEHEQWAGSEDNEGASDNADEANMVHMYPEYLLSGIGAKLLRLCMVKWSPVPGARPTCEEVLAQLADM